MKKAHQIVLSMLAGIATAQTTTDPSELAIYRCALEAVKGKGGKYLILPPEKNWIPTVPGKSWFAYFRFYNPTEGAFDRSWPLPNFEVI